MGQQRSHLCVGDGVNPLTLDQWWGGGGFERRGWSRRALTGVNIHFLVAVAAVHLTAPVELALAFGGAADARRVVATATAHDLAAVCATSRPVADAAPGAR